MYNSSCSMLSKYFAEFMGTAILVLMGVGSAVIAGKTIGILGIGLSFGLTLMVLVYALGPVSGCHINPAVTLAMLFSGKTSFKDAFFYIISQLLGGLFGAYLVYLVAMGKADFNLASGFAANGFAEYSPEKYSMHAVAIVEMLMTTVLVLVVFAVGHSDFPKAAAGLAVGGTLIATHMVSVPVSNTSVNFARSLGSAYFSGDWAMHQLWVFGAAQFVAAVVAPVLHRLMFCHK